LAKDRTPLYCGSDKSTTKGFVQSYKNLFFYWILKAGHFVSQPQLSSPYFFINISEKKTSFAESFLIKIVLIFSFN